MNKSIQIFMITLGMIFLFQGCNSLNETRKTDALVIGKIYYLANPLMELNKCRDLDVFLNEISQTKDLDDLFSENGYYVKKMKELGRRLINEGNKKFSLEDANQAYERALGMEATAKQADRIRSEYNNNALDLIAFGKELNWLSEVLPSYINKDNRLFYSTGTEIRLTIRYLLPTINSMGSETINQFNYQYDEYLTYLVAVLIFPSL